MLIVPCLDKPPLVTVKQEQKRGQREATGQLTNVKKVIYGKRVECDVCFSVIYALLTFKKTACGGRNQKGKISFHSIEYRDELENELQDKLRKVHLIDFQKKLPR